MNTEEMVSVVRDWLDKDDWKYEYEHEDELIHMGINLRSKIKNAKIFIDFKEDGYLVYVVAPIKGDKDNLGELMKYVTMANYGLINGNFEVDVRDGEIRYKTFVNCDGVKELSDQVVEDSICVGCAMMDRYGNGLAALALGFSDADTEMENVEKKEKKD